MKRATISDAPECLDLQSKAMWVLGYNEALTAFNKEVSLRNCHYSESKYRHIPTGREYLIQGSATLQTAVPLRDMAEVVVYYGEDGRMWVRGGEEFDSRFVHIK